VQTRLGPLSATDTLWRLAEQVRPDPRLSVYQVMFALYEKNPDAFLDDNFNHLKPGAYLDVPTISEIRAVDPIAAQRKSENDDRLWAEKIRLAAQQPKVSNEQSAQREDLKNLQKELTDEFSRVEAEQDEALRDIRERMTASMSNVETIVQENTQLKKQLNTVVDELAAVQTQLGKDSEIQLQLQQLLAQQAEILAKQQEQIRKQEEGFNFAQAWQNLASSPAGWLIAGTLPALVLLYFIVMAIRRRGQKTEEMVAAATAAPLEDPNYKSPLPPMDDSLDFDESSLINLDDSLLQAGSITASPLDGAPNKAKPAATINLDDDLLDDHFDLGSDLKLDHDLLDDTLLDDSSQPKPTAAPVEFDANNILSGDDLSSLLASVEAEAPAFEAKTDFDPNNILSGDDLSSLFANLEDDDDLTAPPPPTASNEHLVPEHSAADMPEEIEIDLPDDLQQTVDDADIDALLNSHQSESPQAGTDNTTNQQATSTTSTDSTVSDDDFDIDSLLDSVQTAEPAQNPAPIAAGSSALIDDDDIDIDALLSANATELDAASTAETADLDASSSDTTTPNSALMSAEDDIDALLDSAAGSVVSPAESILEQSAEGVIDSSELDAFAESLADDVLVPADLLVDEHSPEPADMDVEALLAAVDQQQFGQAPMAADRNPTTTDELGNVTASNTDIPAAIDLDVESGLLGDAPSGEQDDFTRDANEKSLHQGSDKADAQLSEFDTTAMDSLAIDNSEQAISTPESFAFDNPEGDLTEFDSDGLASAELDSDELAEAEIKAPALENSSIENKGIENLSIENSDLDDSAMASSDMAADDIEMIDETLLDASMSAADDMTLRLDTDETLPDDTDDTLPDDINVTFENTTTTDNVDVAMEPNHPSEHANASPVTMLRDDPLADEVPESTDEGDNQHPDDHIDLDVDADIASIEQATADAELTTDMPALADLPVSDEAKLAAMADLAAAEFALDDIHQMLQGSDNAPELATTPPSSAPSPHAGLATMHADHAEFAEFDADFAVDTTSANASALDITDDFSAIADVTDAEQLHNAQELDNRASFAAEMEPQHEGHQGQNVAIDDAAGFETSFDAVLDADLPLELPADLTLSASKAPDLQQGDDASVPVLTESQRSVEQPSLMLDEYPELEIADDWLTDDAALAALMDAEENTAAVNTTPALGDAMDEGRVDSDADPRSTAFDSAHDEQSAEDAAYDIAHGDLDDAASAPQQPTSSSVAEPFRASKAQLTVSDALAALDADSETAAELAAIDALNFDALLAELDDDFDPQTAAKPLLLDDEAMDASDFQGDVKRAELTPVADAAITSNMDAADASVEIPDYVHIDKLLAATDDLQQAEATPALDVDVGFADFDNLIEPHEVGDVDAADAGFASKLDLVRAYIEIGDADNAAALVREIGQSDAPDSVKAEAKKLLS
jgi:FimV-like protein